MRIAFICSGLEPGRDGVGDYSRHLAVECIRRGHEAVILSLHDNGGAVSEIQTCEGIPVQCLRCPASLPWEERLQSAREFLTAFHPDWISLQFVPYGYHSRGMPWRLASGLKSLIAGRPLQIMFHELWISPGKASSLKHKLLGALQRWIIFRMIRILKPRAIHTSNPLYADLLRNGGAEPEELPLFGNIPVVDVGPEPALPEQLAASEVPVDAAGRSGWWWVLFFGTLHPEWRSEPFISILIRAAKRMDKRLCLISVGRIGVAGETIWETMQREYGEEIVFVKCGEQPEDRISLLLQLADFGVAASPLFLIGKSGTANAMFEHGLPVICPRDEGIAPSALPSNPLLYRCDASLEARLVEGLPKRAPARRVGEICTRFLAALTLE